MARSAHSDDSPLLELLALQKKEVTMAGILALNKDFTREVMRVAIPIALQNLSGSLLNAIDVMIIGKLSDVHIAAVGSANQIFFIYSLFLFGCCSGASIFLAQFWGDNDIKSIHKVMGILIASVVVISVPFTIGAFVFPTQIMSAFYTDALAIEIGARYLRAVSLSYIFTGLSSCYYVSMRCTGQPRAPLFISTIAIVSNTILNFMLIFGVGFIPRMAETGSGVATLIARVIEFAIIIYFVYAQKNILAASFKTMFTFGKGFVKKYMKSSLPVVINEAFWGIGVSIYILVYSRMGTEVAAAASVASNIERLFLVFVFGIGAATAVIVGKKIGEGKLDVAFEYSVKLSFWTTLLGAAFGIALVVLGPMSLKFYNMPAIVEKNSAGMLIAMGSLMFIKSFNIVNIVGVLRSGGDTMYTMILDCAAVWLVGIPMAVWGGLYLNLPLWKIYCMVYLEEIIKFVLGLHRMLSKKWINRLVGE